MDLKKYFVIFFSSLVFSLNPCLSNANAEGIELKNSKKQMITASLNTKEQKLNPDISKPVDEWYEGKFVFPEEFEKDKRSLLGKKLMDEEIYFLTQELTKNYNIAPFDRKSIEEHIDNFTIKNLCKIGWDEFKETEVGAKCQRIEGNVFAKLTTGYFKNTGEEGKFYFFGQLDPDELDEKKEIKATVRGSFYIDSSLEEHYFAEGKIDFYKNNIKAIYDFDKEQLGVSFDNETINYIFDPFSGKFKGKTKYQIFVNKEFEGNLEARLGMQILFNFN